MKITEYYSGRVLAILASSQQLTAWLKANNALLYSRRGNNAYVFNK